LPFVHYVLDFDHRSGTWKRANINVLAKRGVAIEILEDEMTKCDLICANCHRIRTFERKQNYQNTLE